VLEAEDAAPRGLMVRPGCVIPESELQIRATRSGGPGGQNVNKVSTRIELGFDLEHSAAFGPEDKARLRARLGRRLGAEGRLRIVAQRFRSQSRNLEDARERLAALLAAGLEEPRARRPTRVPAGARRRRVDAKRRRSTVKRQRQPLRGADAGD
jgi:ribosome-associated protein